LIKKLIAISGEEIVCVTDQERVRTTETSRLIGDNSKMKTLGWKPKYSLEETLKEIYLTTS
jgi:GDP-4-dehydro-6-deoxy-D-mannose reductase